MQNLRIGQVVRFDAIAGVVYNPPSDYVNSPGQGYTEPKYYDRTISNKALAKPEHGIVSGITVKHTGRYDTRNWYLDLDGGGCSEATLSSKGTIRVWEVRIGWLNKPVLVSDEHIKPSRKKFTLPQIKGRPKYATV